MQGAERQQYSKWRREEALRVLFGLPQLVSLLWRIKFRAALVALAFMLVAALYASTQSISYQVAATFRDQSSSTNQVGRSGGTLSLEQSGGSRRDKVGPVAVMRSRAILEPIITELRMQASLHQRPPANHTQRLLGKTNKLLSGFAVEMAQQLNDAALLPKPQPLPVRVESVHYSGHQSLGFILTFVRDSEYLVFDEEGILIGQSKLGEVFEHGGLQLVLEGQAHGELAGNGFVLQVEPTWKVLKHLRQAIDIHRDIDSDRVYQVTYNHGDPDHAARLVNLLIDNYIAFLNAEVKRKTDEKLSFLETRKRELLTQMEDFVLKGRTHAAVGDGPEKFLDYESQAKLLSARQDELEKKLSVLNLRLQSLTGFLEQGAAFFPQTLREIPELDGLLSRIRTLKQKRDGLFFDLQIVEEETEEWSEPMSAQIEEIEKLERKGAELDLLIANLSKPRPAILASLESTPGKLPLVSHPNNRLIEHLKNIRRQNQMQTRMLQNKLKFDHKKIPTFTGLNLETATRLYDQTHKSLDEANEVIEELNYAYQHLADPEFPVSSLSGTLSDPVSKALMEEASGLESQIDNDAYYTNKELAYFRTFLEKKRSALTKHIGQKAAAAERDAHGLKSKVHGLQSHMLSLINKELAVQEHQMQELVSAKKESVLQERTTVKRRLQELEVALQKLPDKWAAEQEWRLRSQLGGDMTRALTEMVEAINITAHIGAVDAQPLDQAVSPIMPNSLHVLRLMAIAGFLGVTFTLILGLVSDAVRGFTPTPRALEALGGRFAGVLPRERSVPMDKNPALLEVFRTAILKGPQETTLALLPGAAECVDPNAVAQLLSLKGRRVLLMNLPSSGSGSELDTDPLLEYLKKNRDSVEVDSGEAFDSVGNAASSPFAAELLASRQFSELLNRYMQEYDIVVLASRAPLSTVEAQSLAERADHTVAIIHDERFPVIQHYIDVDLAPNHKYVTFIFDSA